MPTHDLIAVYLRVGSARLRPATVAAYRSDLLDFTRWISLPRTPPQSIQDVGLSSIEDYQVSLHTRGLCPQTIERKMHALRGFFGWAHRRGSLPLNPMVGHQIPRPPDRMARVLTPEEERRLFQVIAGLRHPFDIRGGIPAVRLARYAGLRRGECAELQWEDIDLEKDQLLVLDGKGGQDRMIPIPAQNLGAPLRALWVAAGRPITGPVLRGLYHQRVSPTSLSAAARRYYRLAKIPRATFHALRHRYATQLSELGAHPRVIQLLLGHKSLETTQKYLHVTDSARRQAADLLDID